MRTRITNTIRLFLFVLSVVILPFDGWNQGSINPFLSAKQIDPNKRGDKGYLEFGMKQSDIEDEILQLYQEIYPTIQFKKVIITSDKFYFERDSKYNIKFRLLNVDILVVENGKCKAFDVTVKQKKFHKNYGVFEEELVNGFYPINCTGW